MRSTFLFLKAEIGYKNALERFATVMGILLVFSLLTALLVFT